MRLPGIIASLALLATFSAGEGTRARAAVLDQGTIELTPSLGFTRSSLAFKGSNAGSITHVSASARAGYCVTHRFEIDAGMLMEHQAVSFPGAISEQATLIGATAGVQFNAPHGGRMLPFVRGAIGMATNSGVLSPGKETTLFAPILQAGLRVLAGTRASVNFGLGYRHQSNARGVTDLSAHTFEAEIGVSIFPRLGK